MPVVGMLQDLPTLTLARVENSGNMKRRIGIWAIAGFLVAGFWELYAFATAMTPAGRILPLVRLTCPITLLSSYPLSLYFILLANTATYALAGLIVETLRQRVNHATSGKTNLSPR
jgi:hypothetical protein